MKTLQEQTIRQMSRRNFLKNAAIGIAAAPGIVPASVFGANAPSNRINVGIIGCGNQSTLDIPAFMGHDDAQVVAVCDVNTASHGYKTPDQFLGRKPGQEMVNAFYAKKTGKGSYKGCDAYEDFRQILERKDIDAVLIVAPDQWHAPMVAMAARAGKDIYCEKPLSLTVNQGKAMVQVVKEHKRILQTGSMYRSSPNNRLGCELVRNGRIGQVKKVICNVAANNAVSPPPGWKPDPVPEGFNYDMWLGPAPEAPYHRDRCFYRFRFILDYSGGQTTNFGAHSIDVAQWALGADDTGPAEFEDTGSEWPPKGSLFTTATKVAFRARYANGTELICQTAEPGFGTRFEGTEGWLEYGYKGVRTGPEAIKTSQIKPDEIHLPVSNPKRTEDASKNYIPDHVRNFLDCIKSRQQPIEPAEVGHRTATICHLGNIAMMLGRKIRWDPVKQEIVGDDEAAKMLDRPMRGPWTS